jgi:hypothetical protein
MNLDRQSSSSTTTTSTRETTMMQNAALIFVKQHHDHGSTRTSNATRRGFDTVELGLPLLSLDSPTICPEESCYSVNHTKNQDDVILLGFSLTHDSDDCEDGFALQQGGESKKNNSNGTGTTLSSRWRQSVKYYFTNFRAWALHWLVFIHLDLYLTHYQHNESLVLKHWLIVNYAILVFLGVTYMYQYNLQKFCRLLGFDKDPSPWTLVTFCTYPLLVPELLLDLAVLIACCTQSRGAAFFILTVPTIILVTVSVVLGFLARVFHRRIVLIPELHHHHQHPRG